MRTITPPGADRAPPQGIHPTKSGWHLLRYVDGSIAIVRWDKGHGWEFGSQRPPNGTVTSMTFLGGDVTAMSLNLGHLAPTFGRVWNTIVSQIDTGGLGRGQPLVLGRTGKLQPGTTVNQGDAVPINQIPSPIPPSTGNSHLNFSSITDFLGFIGWFFDPRTWLRFAEFGAGLALLIWGVVMLTRGGGRGGPTAHPIIRRAVSVTPAGRVMRVRQGRRMGRHEGQREAARMEARQQETRSQRESSAVEREQINRSARETARNSPG